MRGRIHFKRKKKKEQNLSPFISFLNSFIALRSPTQSLSPLSKSLWMFSPSCRLPAGGSLPARLLALALLRGLRVRRARTPGFGTWPHGRQLLSPHGARINQSAGVKENNCLQRLENPHSKLLVPLTSLYLARLCAGVCWLPAAPSNGRGVLYAQHC